MSTNDDDVEAVERIEREFSRSPEELRTLGRGPEALRRRLAQAAGPKVQLTIRLDADVVERFRELAGEDGNYQTLINQALREWLTAGSVRDLIRADVAEMRRILEEALLGSRAEP